ncbi:MAG: hypothetical protein SFU53_00690 [Terrimicrobiaceae bacterium]|nr:hypothetical protein [Terrimicrobiaceae bacterium]
MINLLEALVRRFPRRTGLKPSIVALHAAARNPSDATRSLACLLTLESRLGGWNNLIVQLPSTGGPADVLANRFPFASWGEVPAVDPANPLWWCDGEVLQRAFQRTYKNVIVFIANDRVLVPGPIFREACEGGLREEILVCEKGTGRPIARIAFRENLKSPARPRVIEGNVGRRSFFTGFAVSFLAATKGQVTRGGIAGKLRSAAFWTLVGVARPAFPAIGRVAASTIRADSPAGPETHVLACTKYLEETFAAASTFAFFSATRPRFIFHDDGSLDAAAIKRLEGFAGGSRVVRKSEADAAAETALAGYPHCLALRRELPLSLKFFDIPLFAEGERLILLDSDILFFDDPAELMSRYRTGGQWFNEEVPEQYGIGRPNLEKLLGMKIRRNINSGIVAADRALFDFEFAEKVLSICDGKWVYPHLAEQTLFAICASRLPEGGLLPRTYEISPKLFRRKDAVARHYAAHLKFGSLFIEGVFDLLPRLVFSGRPAAKKVPVKNEGSAEAGAPFA